MTELITYDTIRKAHRAEKQEIALQKLPDSFFLAVRGWLDHKQITQKGTASLLEIENAKRLLDDLLNRREKKMVIAALHTIRGDVPPTNMTLDEEKFFDSLVNMLRKTRQDLREQLFGYDSIIEEKLESARSAMDEMKASGESTILSSEKKSEDLKSDNSEKENNAEDNNAENESTENDHVADGTNEKTVAAANPSGITKLKLIADMPSFVDAGMKAYGPFKSGTVTELPNEMAQILLARNVAVTI
ncbi:MAG: hypothetical protein WA139_01960 [Candidatus Aenigmatarchaeota archaeon]